MDKIIFRITGALTAVTAADHPALDNIVRNSRLDIKVLDVPSTVADQLDLSKHFQISCDPCNQSVKEDT